MKRLFILFVLVSIIGVAQNAQIDSLKNEIKYAKTKKSKAKNNLLLIDAFAEISMDSANVYISKSINETKNVPDLYSVYIETLLKKAQLLIISGDYKASDNVYKDTWIKLKDNYDYDLYTTYYGDYGILQFYKGDFKKAKNYFEKALNLSQKENNEEDEIKFLNNSALAMSYLGEGEESILVHEKSILLAKKLNDSTSLGKSFNNIGLIYEDMKAYDKALNFYLEALEIKKNGKSEIDIANSLYNVAGMYKEIGEEKKDTTYYLKAEIYYQKAIDLAKKNNYGKVLLFSKTGKAALATVRKKYDEAIKLYNEVILEAEKNNDQQTLRISYLNLGVNYIKVDDIVNAELFLLKAKPLIEESENPSDLQSLYKNLSILYEEKGLFEKAYKYQSRFFKIDKELNKNSLQEKVSDFEVKYQTEKKEKEILKQRAKLAEQKNYIIIASSLVLLAIFIGYLIYSTQRNKNKQLQKEKELELALSKIESQNKLQEQRLEISRDLHDTIGAQLTFIISSIDNLKYGFTEASSKITNKLGYISNFTKDTIYELRDTIWAMNKDEITVEDLNSRVSNFITNANLAAEHIQFNFKSNFPDEHKVVFSSKTGMNVYRIIQEAVNNAIKHAEASNIEVRVEAQENVSTISIKDNGKGFNPDQIENGNGLNSMKKRAEELKASFDIKPLENGTHVELILKHENNNTFI